MCRGHPYEVCVRASSQLTGAELSVFLNLQFLFIGCCSMALWLYGQEQTNCNIISYHIVLAYTEIKRPREIHELSNVEKGK